MTSQSFEERLISLAGRIGVPCGSLESEHARWDIYSRAIQTPEEWPELVVLIGLEPDTSVASSVVVRVLEVAPNSWRHEFVAALPPGRDRDYALVRARELSIIDSLLVESGSPADAGFDTRDWSTWLQLRVANSVRRESVLESLGSTGSTRRIRVTAERRLRSLRASGELET